MALTYQEDLTQRFVEGFSQDVVCQFPDGYYNGTTDLGNAFINMSTFDQVNEQPSDEYWMSMLVTESFTFNSSITNGIAKHKRLLVFVDFTVYWPVEASKRLLQETIEPALDGLFLNINYRGTDDSEVHSQQDAPKDIVRVVRATGSNKFNSKTMRYPMVVRYVL